MVCHVPGSHQKVNGVSVLNLPGDTALDALKTVRAGQGKWIQCGDWLSTKQCRTHPP